MTGLESCLEQGRAAGCPADQMRHLLQAGVLLQPRQLAASAAARQCDLADGPTAVGYGGARGGGKSFWLLAQMGADDCQRLPGLKCLLLRKVGKSNLEHFEDLRQRVFGRLPHEFATSRGVLTFANGSRIVAGHFQHESDIDAYLGLEYDVIGIEEATTLSNRKHQDIVTCCRTSKLLPDGRPWRPRLYSTTNPGGVGHAWYRRKFIQPFQERRETDTRFIPARVTDNQFCNAEYVHVLRNLRGWQRRAWLEGDWDIAAGQFFTMFRREVHVVDDPDAGGPGISPQFLPPATPQKHAGLTPVDAPPQPAGLSRRPVFDETRAREWFAALDYGYHHYTVVLLGCKDGDGNVFVVDEHAERLWLPQRHAAAIKAMVARHRVRLGFGIKGGVPQRLWGPPQEPQFRPLELRDLRRFVAGADVFSRQSDGTTIVSQYVREGISLLCANTDRVNGWAEILQRLGDPEAGIAPKLFIHRRCERLLETLPALLHDPNRPEDVLKVDLDDDGDGGDDAADALRYLVATKPREIVVRRLTGL